MDHVGCAQPVKELEGEIAPNSQSSWPITGMKLASFREAPGFNLTLLFLWMAFVLLAVSLFTGLAILSIVGGIAAIISSVIAATASFTDLHRRAGLGEVLIVDEIARKARERLAKKIRPSEAPRHPEAS